MSVVVGKKLKKVLGSLKCPYCKKQAKFQQGKTRNRWVCNPCGAWVSTPKKSNEPHGTWANAKLRNLRREVKFQIEYLCSAKASRYGITEKEARQAGYTWLAKALHVKFEKFEIRSLDEYKCQKALDACSPSVHKLQKKKAIMHRKAKKKREEAIA